jgi:hypothetical protein
MWLCQLFPTSWMNLLLNTVAIFGSKYKTESKYSGTQWSNFLQKEFTTTLLKTYWDIVSWGHSGLRAFQNWSSHYISLSALLECDRCEHQYRPLFSIRNLEPHPWGSFIASSYSDTKITVMVFIVEFSGKIYCLPGMPYVDYLCANKASVYNKL